MRFQRAQARLLRPVEKSRTLLKIAFAGTQNMLSVLQRGARRSQRCAIDAEGQA